jgi:hypothetical protein
VVLGGVRNFVAEHGRERVRRVSHFEEPVQHRDLAVGIRGGVDAIVVEHDDFPIEIRLLCGQHVDQPICDALHVGLNPWIRLERQMSLHRQPLDARLAPDFLLADEYLRLRNACGEQSQATGGSDDPRKTARGSH